MSIPPSTSSDTFHGCIAEGNALLLPDKSDRDVLQKLPLPGVVIFVHGVNSDGEWFEATERGLCAGLNARLARKKEQLAYPGPAGGELTPNDYLEELDDEGFLSRDRDANTFVTDRPAWSPVLRFRWGYKADPETAQTVGRDIWLNESDYWGGGPFANGCSALPDLWGEGVDPNLFLWYSAQDINPEPGREVYACPPRHYYALAAWRLAELVALIRKKQADLPITIVCHSQGNMIGLAAAFYGDKIGNVTDPRGKSAPAIADAYVLANAPYSLVEKLGTDNLSQSGNVNAAGERGRVTGPARFTTLANFVKLIAARRGTDQDLATVVRLNENRAPRDGSPGYDVEDDRGRYARHGRITVYCNPHDRVISTLTVQGIGWRGIGINELSRVDTTGALVQRVWAEGLPVGTKGEFAYHRSDRFWNPPSRQASYSLVRAWDAAPDSARRLMSLVTTPISWLAIKIVGVLGGAAINADPPTGWKVPVNAPALPETHLPHAERLGVASLKFDQGLDPDTDRLRARDEAADENADATRTDDPYAGLRRTSRPDTDARDAEARRADEAQLKYEHRARLRMHDRRRDDRGERGEAGNAGRPGPDGSARAWSPWARDKLSSFLKESVDQHATDHSTIMCCALNAEKVLAYDIPVGASFLTADDWRDLRIAADWQLWDDLEDDNPLKRFGQYFKSGLWAGEEGKDPPAPLHEHKDFNAREYPEAMPPGIVDERTIAPRPGEKFP
jgi:hypothetical protein